MPIRLAARQGRDQEDVPLSGTLFVWNRSSTRYSGRPLAVLRLFTGDDRVLGLAELARRTGLPQGHRPGQPARPPPDPLAHRHAVTPRGGAGEASPAPPPRFS
ncbi:helix-turn-helix domain-containing protein [Streptomyces sp. NRRL F-5123]|uniref:helix-turn-helix domain-containing protein n=1 Tax=Streptomyces sp. NRRL F-5123 TaxID=1463856 RepID=UPI000D147180